MTRTHLRGDGRWPARVWDSLTGAFKRDPAPRGKGGGGPPGPKSPPPAAPAPAPASSRSAAADKGAAKRARGEAGNGRALLVNKLDSL